MRDIEQKISNVSGSMAIEGLILTESDKARLRSLLRGEKSYDAAIAEIVKRYTLISKSND